jgi:hypothetical protein
LIAGPNPKTAVESALKTTVDDGDTEYLTAKRKTKGCGAVYAKYEDINYGY